MPTSNPHSMEAVSIMLLHKTNISRTRHIYGPTYGFIASPEVSPRAYVDTVNMGYPLQLGPNKTPMAAIKGSLVANPTRG